jgi:hypothetical protein
MFAMVFKCFHVFLQVFHTHVLSILSVFKCMLQVLRLDVSKVDRLLHMLQCDLSVAAAGWGTRGQAGRRHRVGSGGGADAAWYRVGHRCHIGSAGTWSADLGV